MKSPQRLDAEVATLLSSMPPAPVFTADTLDKIRAERAAMPQPPLSDEVDRTNVQIRSDPPLQVRIHRPKHGPQLKPAVYSMHGGGYVVGSFLVDDARLDTWCRRFHCVGVSVDYRLAPETPYPGPMDDCYAGLKWLFENASELGVDPSRIGLFGSSAGGGLAAGLSLLARDVGELEPAFQMLFYPMIDDRQVTPSSQWDDVPSWTPVSNTFGWRSYLGELYGTPDIPLYAAPARAVDLRGVPPTYIMVGSLDAFYDEDIDFARRLLHAGVPTDLSVYAGAPHAFDRTDGDASVAVRARRAASDWLATRLSTQVAQVNEIAPLTGKIRIVI